MEKAVRTVIYDDKLQLEAYRFKGTSQPFPKHFHEHYVIGLITHGTRRLVCLDAEYTIEPGMILLFAPGDTHACSGQKGSTLDYLGLNISKESMQNLASEIMGRRMLPGFSQNVVCDEEAVYYLSALHEMLQSNTEAIRKEECLLLLMTLLLEKYGQPFCRCTPECRQEIGKACAYMTDHYAEPVCLDDVCRHVNLSKSALLRAFTKEKGVTPYRYLETIRINEAKRLLENGASPLEAAMQTGFWDQSHFTNYFSRFIGLTPGVYHEIFSGKNKKEQRNQENESGK